MGARARAERREANNRTASRQIVLGVLAALFGGTFWGFSGTAASFLFTNYHVETTWLMSMRLLGSGCLSATVSSVIVLGTVFMPTYLIGFALIIAMVFLTV